MMYPGGASLIASATWLSISSISWRICWMYSSREILGVGSMARSSLGKSLTYIDQTAWIAPGKFATHRGRVGDVVAAHQQAGPARRTGRSGISLPVDGGTVFPLAEMRSWL